MEREGKRGGERRDSGRFRLVKCRQRGDLISDEEEDLMIYETERRKGEMGRFI